MYTHTHTHTYIYIFDTNAPQRWREAEGEGREGAEKDFLGVVYTRGSVRKSDSFSRGEFNKGKTSFQGKKIVSKKKERPGYSFRRWRIQQSPRFSSCPSHAP